MNNLKILVPYPNSFDVVSNTSLIIHSLLPILKKKINVQILWVLYQPEKIQSNKNNGSEIITLDLHDYVNAVDLLQKEKPDIIYVAPFPEFIHYSFAIAGKFLKIPVVNLLYYELSMGNTLSTKQLSSSYIRRAFSNSVPTEEFGNKKTFLRRGKYIFYKFSFLINTLFATKMNFFKIIKDAFTLLSFPIKSNAILDSKFSITKHYLQNYIIYENLLKNGFKESSLLVTGNSMFDEYFDSSGEITINNKIRLLLAPDAFYEHGSWTKEQRSEILEKIIKYIMKHKEKFSLIVKIHPSAANLDDYRKIIHSIDPSIPVFQDGGIQNYLDKTDVVISYSTQSTGLIYSLLSKKPIIICNFFKEELEEFIDTRLIIECKSIDSFEKTLNGTFSHDSIYEELRNQYISKYLFKGDGLSGMRICDDLLSLANKK
jgi:hypothetical protein